MSSGKDEIEILSVVTKPTEGLTCGRCGSTLGTASLLSHHQLMSCEMRSPAEIRHARYVLTVAKLCELDEMQVFALEREAGLEPLPGPGRPARSPAAADPPADASVERRLEAISRMSLSDVPEELAESLLTEASQAAILADTGGPEPPPGRANSTVYQLDTTPLSYEVLRMPQYQELFDRLRLEAAAVAPARLDTELCQQHGIGASLLLSLTQQADELRAETQSEFIEHHFCHQCGQHVERAQLLLHLHPRLRDTCGFCGYRAGNIADMKNHLSRQHQMKRKLSCPLCRTRYSTPQAYRDHVITHRLDEQLLLPGEFDSKSCNPNRLFEWQCELCNQIPPGVSVKFKEIREHTTVGCRMLYLSDADFNRRFPLAPARGDR